MPVLLFSFSSSVILGGMPKKFITHRLLLKTRVTIIGLISLDTLKKICVSIVFEDDICWYLERARACVCQDTLRHIWGVRINDVMFWVSSRVFLPSSFISISKNVIFHLQRRNSSLRTAGEKTMWYMVPQKDDIIDIYKSIYDIRDEKILEMRRLL